MIWLFWVASALIVYVYVGYPACLWVRGRWCPRPVRRARYQPFVSIVLVTRNEAHVIAAKLKNLLALHYPRDLYEIVLVWDRADDAVAAEVGEYVSDPRVRLIRSRHRGKAAGLNDALAVARGEIIVFTDTRQKVDPDAICLLLENFADATVGCASGELMLGDPDAGESLKGVGLYWKIEKSIRELESHSGSVIGATGALYAARRSVLPSLSADTILDDVYIPMTIARERLRIVFDSRAHAWDSPDVGGHREFYRKIRTLSGNYQLLRIAPWLLTKANPVRFEFVSHKLLRLLVPFALVATFASTLMLEMPIYRLGLLLQVAFYFLAVLSLLPFKLGRLKPVADAAFTFVLLNAAASVAFYNFITGRKPVWV